MYIYYIYVIVIVMEKATELMHAFSNATQEYMIYGSTRYIAGNDKTYAREFDKWSTRPIFTYHDQFLDAL